MSFIDAGWVRTDTFYTYNASGELTDQSVYGEDTAQDLITKYGTGVATSAYATPGLSAANHVAAVGSSTDGALYLETDTSYTASSGYGYDADGNVLGYHVTTTSNLGQTARTDSYQNT